MLRINRASGGTGVNLGSHNMYLNSDSFTTGTSVSIGLQPGTDTGTTTNAYSFLRTTRTSNTSADFTISVANETSPAGTYFTTKFGGNDTSGKVEFPAAVSMAGELDMGSNNITTTGKVLFANMYSLEGNLPNASTYHGMFAHVHATGAGYFAHNGSWVRLANNSDIPTVPTNISSFTNDSGYTTSSYANSSVDSHINVSGASGGQVLSWTGSDYAWVTRGTSSSDTTYTAGSGLSLSGTEFSVNSDQRTHINMMGYSSSDYLQVDDSNFRFYINGTQEFLMQSDGDFHADGNLIAYSTSTSDPRLKENILPVENALEKLEKLTGYTFNYKKDGKASAGILSTEVEEVLPSAVQHKKLPLQTDDDIEYGVVEYDQLTAILIEAVKELSARVKDLENGSSK